MLGVKRNAVSTVARDMQTLGLIEYTRGRVRALDRQRLEAVSFECYGVVRTEVGKLFADDPSPECDD